MANTLAALVRFSSNSLSTSITSVIMNKIQQPQIVRHLYAKSMLGLDGFSLQCEKSKAQLTNIADRFKTKMNDYAVEDSKSMIFTEDLKNMIHIAETSEDVDLVIRMTKKFNGQNKELRFGTFCFGPVIMRMFHNLNKYEEALNCFKSEELQGFFDQYMSFQVLLDLLYENQKYNEILEVFEIIKKKQLEGMKYPKNVITLTLAACYKLNTAESLKYAIDLWRDINNVGHMPARRSVTFCAGLALNQGQSETALEIISSAKNQFYTTVRNIKVSALVDLGRGDDVLLILKSVLNKDSPDGKQITFNIDVLEKVKTYMNTNDSVELKTEFDSIYNIFKKDGHVSDATLDEVLCSEIIGPIFTPFAQKQKYDRYQKPFNTNRTRDRPFYSNQRPGLSELQ